MKNKYKIQVIYRFMIDTFFKLWMAAICLLTVLVLCGTSAMAQGLTVSGTVVSAADGGPLAGVNILVVGTQQGTNTGADGTFTLDLEDPNATLRFTYIGYTAKTVAVEGQSDITVTLEQATAMLDDIVVTALGLEKQSKSLGYSVSEVESAELVEATETNVANLLQGKVAGLNVAPTSGGPGASSRVTIRGASSLAGNNQPLYVVDGVPIDNSNLGSAGLYGGFDGGDGISSINSQNIENISVLKGAAAAALYGARARDGVIQITTKSGSGLSQGPIVNVKSAVTFEDALVGFSDYQSEYGQGELGAKPENQEEALATGLNSWGAPLDGSPVVQFDGEQRPYADQGNQLDNFYRSGVSNKSSLSLSGGDENTTYYFSSVYEDAQSIVPNSGLNRTSVTLRGTQSLGNFSADVKANYTNEKADNRTWLSDSPGNANFAVSILPPNLSTQALEDNYITAEGREGVYQNVNTFVNNPYWVVNQWDTDDTKDRIIGHVKLDYDFTNWLSLTGRTGLDRYTLRRTSFTPWGTAYRPNGDMTENEFRVLESTTDLLLNLDKQLNSSFAIRSTLGGTVSYRSNENVGISGNTFKVPKLRTISNMANISPIYSFSEKKVNSIYASVDLSYNDYLFATVTGRNDWSSTLPEDENAFFYPSVSGSFVFTDAFEMPSWFSFGKVRASWAEVGSDTDPYQLSLTYSILNFTHQGQSAAAISKDEIPLATLKPTSTTEFEVGFDVRFIDDRISLDASYYDRQTTDQILSTTVSNTTGYGSRVINAGRLDNKGIELLLTGVPVQSQNVLWETSINYTRNKSEVVALAGEQQSLLLAQSRTQNASVTATVGEEYGTIRGFEYKRDDKGNIVHENGLPVQADEQTVLGRGTPDWTAGWSNTISYKSLSLNALIGVSWGGQLYSGTNSYAYGAGLHENTLVGRAGCDQAGTPYSPCYVAEGVKQVDTDADGNPIYGANDVAVLPSSYYGANAGIAGNISEEFVYDANYIKLRQLRLSYQLPQSLVSRIPVRSATISAIGRNLFYLHDSVPNVDPEAAINRGNAQGLELAGVPATRSYGFSINLGF